MPLRPEREFYGKSFLRQVVLHLEKTMMSMHVETWNNAGERSVVPCASLAEAKKLAKQYRTVAYQTVKIGDAFGTLTHWSRVVGEKGNRWNSREVNHDVFLSQD